MVSMINTFKILNSILGMIIINREKPISRVANGMSGINKRI